MHLVEQYALTTGVKITKPFIEASYYPLVFDKYIVVENGHDVKSRTYGMWADVISEIKPYLDEKQITIIQIGDGKDDQIPGCYDLRGRTSIKQSVYVLKKSLLHCSTNDFFLDVATSFNIPVVAMYGSTFAGIAKPYWGNESQQILLESDRKGKKPTFLADESPRTVNFITPEKISNGILKLLKIKLKTKIKTKFIGDLYTAHVLEAVPNFSPPVDFNPELVVNLRMDYHFDLQNMANWGSNRKINIFTNKIIDLNYINAIKKNIVGFQQEICTDLNSKYLNILKNLRVPCELFTKNERALGKLRMKYFDHKIILKKEKTFEDLKESNESFTFSENFYYKSNKLLLSNGKKYLNKYDYLAGREYKGESHKIVNDPKFWEDQDYLRIYEKNV
jgi:hypothetical protein